MLELLICWYLFWKKILPSHSGDLKMSEGESQGAEIGKWTSPTA